MKRREGCRGAARRIPRRIEGAKLVHGAEQAADAERMADSTQAAERLRLVVARDAQSPRRRGGTVVGARARPRASAARIASVISPLEGSAGS
jgi:hypothetical protein